MSAERTAPDGVEVARLSASAARRLGVALALATAAFIALWALRAADAARFEGWRLVTALGVGAFAQLVDGALGMAYGVTSNALLLATGLPPAAATASVHVAKGFTTAGSGLAHWRLGNIDKRVFGAIVLPGVVGGLAGAVAITRVDGGVIRPWIAAYLLAMGLYIIHRAFRAARAFDLSAAGLTPVAAIGGFVDSVGGGGWGPVVTTTLLGAGHEPRTAIGSVNAAEFFVALGSGFSFVLLVGLETWDSVAGLIIGGLLVAPFAARLTRRLPRRTVMTGVGALIVGLSLWTISRTLGS